MSHRAERGRLVTQQSMTTSLRETYEVAHKVLDFPRPLSGEKRLGHILTAPRPPSCVGHRLPMVTGAPFTAKHENQDSASSFRDRPLGLLLGSFNGASWWRKRVGGQPLPIPASWAQVGLEAAAGTTRPSGAPRTHLVCTSPLPALSRANMSFKSAVPSSYFGLGTSELQSNVFPTPFHCQHTPAGHLWGTENPVLVWASEQQPDCSSR